MNKKKLISAVMAVALGAASVSSAVLTVSKSGGMFNTVQAAVDAAKAGDEIVIDDKEIYEEQVTFENKRELILRSKNPGSLEKPVIRWYDDENVGPTTCTDSKNPEMVNYDRNGAVRVIGSKNIVIEGLSVDGEKANPFAYAGVWDCRDEHFTGNAALLLNSSSSVVVRNCEMRNAFYGIYLADNNMAQIIENSNSGIVDPLTVGGHLFEHNRIHDNSWGVYMESVRGVGSTVRFNLIYSNFHSEEVLSIIEALPGGIHHPGGALIFKDNYIVPLAIHNNTFWNNYLIYSGHWKPGGQHLIFNNIYGKPKYYWSDGYQPSDEYRNPFQAMDGGFINRSNNCLYAAQGQAPKTRSQVYEISCLGRDTTITAVSQVNISNEISGSYVATDGVTFEFEHPDDGAVCAFAVPWVKNPGALISDPESFPEEAEMRWFEVEFMSTDPSSPDFLKPDWSDTYVNEFIKNKGWAASGIVNAEGNNPDIGAVQSGGYPCGTMMVRPNTYFDYNHLNDTADLSFIIESGEEISDLEIEYLNLVSDAPVQSNSSFGGYIEPVAASAIHTLPIPSTSLQMGDNTLQLHLPSSLGEYAFIEMVIGGVNGDGEPVISNVLFIPFRQSIYKFTAELFDTTGTEKISSLVVGSKAVLKVTPEDFSEVFENNVTEIQFSCRNSGESWTIDNVENSFIDTIIMTKAGIEVITISGVYDSPSMGMIPFHGVSEHIAVTTDQVSDVVFVSPVSDRGGELPAFAPGLTIPMVSMITDEYGNPAVGPVTVTFESLDPDIAVLTGTGQEMGEFSARTDALIQESAAPGDTFRIVATLDVNGVSDTVVCVVADPSSPVIIRQKINTPENLSIQLVDLRGRTVDKFIGSLTDYQDRIRRTRNVSGRGVYLMKVTDLKTGKKSVHRLVGQKLRNAVFKLK